MNNFYVIVVERKDETVSRNILRYFLRKSKVVDAAITQIASDDNSITSKDILNRIKPKTGETK